MSDSESVRDMHSGVFDPAADADGTDPVYGGGSNFGLPERIFLYVPAALTLCPKPHWKSAPSCVTTIFPGRNFMVILQCSVSGGTKVAMLPSMAASPLAEPRLTLLARVT